MFTFAISGLSLAVMLIFPLLYLIGRYIRALIAHKEGQAGPKDRVVLKVIIAAIIGFMVGSFLQIPWNKYQACIAAQGARSVCLIDSVENKTIMP